MCKLQIDLEASLLCILCKFKILFLYSVAYTQDYFKEGVLQFVAGCDATPVKKNVGFIYHTQGRSINIHGWPLWQASKQKNKTKAKKIEPKGLFECQTFSCVRACFYYNLFIRLFFCVCFVFSGWQIPDVCDILQEQARLQLIISGTWRHILWCK